MGSTTTSPAAGTDRPDPSRIERLCVERGLKMTGQRRLIARVLSDSADHPDVEELYRRASALDQRISIATVYRTVRLLEEKGGMYNIQTRPDGQKEVFRGNTPVVIPQKGHFDWDLRIAHMDQSGIDISVVSLTCPNVYWGGEEVSVQAAREANDNVA